MREEMVKKNRESVRKVSTITRNLSEEISQLIYQLEDTKFSLDSTEEEYITILDSIEKMSIARKKINEIRDIVDELYSDITSLNVFLKENKRDV